MKIRLTFDIDRVTRRAINFQTRGAGLATREQCIGWIEQTIDSTLQHIISEVEASDRERMRGGE